MTDKPATNDELIAQIAAYSDDGTHRTGLLIKAAQALAAQDARIAELEAHIAEQITHCETRIQDGIEMGASVWRIALGDIARENRAILALK